MQEVAPHSHSNSLQFSSLRTFLQEYRMLLQRVAPLSTAFFPPFSTFPRSRRRSDCPDNPFPLAWTSSIRRTYRYFPLLANLKIRLFLAIFDCERSWGYSNKCQSDAPNLCLQSFGGLPRRWRSICLCQFRQLEILSGFRVLPIVLFCAELLMSLFFCRSIVRILSEIRDSRF